MKKWMKLMAVAGCFGLVFSGISAQAAERPATGAEKAAMTQSMFVCPDCHTMALKAGKCPMCQKEMTETHLLGVKDGNALLCACGPTCKCDVSGMKDGKCACGKEVMKISAKGMYVCPKGCPEISDKPGTCACGEVMKKVE